MPHLSNVTYFHRNEPKRAGKLFSPGQPHSPQTQDSPKNAPMPAQQQAFLPDDIILQIVKFVNVKSLACCVCVNKSWHRLLDVSYQQYIWQALYMNKWQPKQIFESCANWKNMYYKNFKFLLLKCQQVLQDHADEGI